MNNPTPEKPSGDRIVRDNLAMHNQPGYAAFYDRQMGLIKNPWERRFFFNQLARLTERIKKQFPRKPLRALDLGAGTGNLSLFLAKVGYQVTAVDLSSAMLARLIQNARDLSLPLDQIQILCSPADTAIERMAARNEKFHLVVACSFYHHLPDYLATLTAAGNLVQPGGYLFLAHEPMRKDTISRPSRWMQWMDFKLWRIKVHARRRLGRPEDADVFHDPASVADFWDLTTGCDQNRMAETLQTNRFDVDLRCYDSKRSRTLHALSRFIGTRTLIMISARKISPDPAQAP